MSTSNPAVLPNNESTPLSVPLPKRPRPSANVAPIWQIRTPTDEEKLLEGCGKADGTKIACCTDQKEEDRKGLINPDIMRDLVIGLADGLTVPFALTAGLSALGSTHFVVTAGLAELISGAFSMGIGGFLAAQAEREQFLYLTKMTELRIKSSCSSQLRREVFETLSTVGLDASASAAVADSLYRVEMETSKKSLGEGSEYNTMMERKPQAGALSKYFMGRVGDRPGLTNFFIRFGEGMEETTRLRMLVSGVTVGTGYIMGGIVPLIPYFIVKDSVLTALWWSIGVTACALLTFGSLKAYFTGAGHGFWGVVYGALSTLAIGGAAAAAAFGVVKALDSGGS